MKHLSRRDFLKATGIAVAAAAAGVYEFVPGTKAIVDQAVRVTKAFPYCYLYDIGKRPTS